MKILKNTVLNETKRKKHFIFNGMRMGYWKKNTQKIGHEWNFIGANTRIFIRNFIALNLLREME